MALIKSRPTIRLMAPSFVQPGATFDMQVVLDARREVPVTCVDVALRGRESVAFGSGNSRTSYAHHLLSQAVRLSEARTLAAGKTTFDWQVELPQALPISYQGRFASIAYTVSVHVPIPWWLDAKHDFVLHVTAPEVTVEDLGHSLHATGSEGPAGKEPHVEFSLSTQQIVPGHRLMGEVALYNVAFNRYGVITLSLIRYETRRRPSGAARIEEIKRYSIRIGADPYEEGVALPFDMKLPSELVPSFEAASCAASWVFEVEAEVAWSRNLTAVVPVSVLPKGSRRKRTQRFAVPTVGSPRVREMWRTVGGELDLRLSEPPAQRLEGVVSGVELEVARDHRGADGIFLIATLRYPSLGIELDGGHASSLQRIMNAGVQLGDEKWDKRHYLTSRDPAQAHAFASALGSMLLAQRVADVDDEHLVVEVRDAGQSAASLLRFVRGALALAARIETARAQIPAPAMMRQAAASWEELARALGASLNRATMSVSGQFEGSDATVATRWEPSGDAMYTSIAITPPEAVLEQHHLRWLSGCYVSGRIESLSENARARVSAILPDAISLEIATQHLELCIAAPMQRATVALARLEQLASLASALRGERGPYR